MPSDALMGRVMADALALHDDIAKRHAGGHVAVAGRSLGSGVATFFAAAVLGAALVRFGPAAGLAAALVVYVIALPFLMLARSPGDPVAA